MSKFVGFPSGKLSVTPLPDLFFTELLAQMDDLAELKVTLHVWWRLAHHKSPLCLSRAELRADDVLRRSLGALSLDDALQRATARGTLIALRTKNAASEVEQWYFANNEAGRRDAARVRQGLVRLRRDAVPLPAAETTERPNVFTLYEQHIGMLTPLVAEQLEDAAHTYAPQWIADAFEIAAKQDKRSWRYAQAILQRWAREGRQKDEGGRRKPSSRPTLKPKR
ncbi:MAG: DnaD domain protein [Chloroflexota bacterium]